MELSSAGPSRPSNVPDVNLYCSQCQAQIGIFRNEWIRLTSSYARSKTRGKHFGTEIGLRTQVVPPGPLQRSAEGCEMAEVLCCKCSNVVGQYCKSAPDPSQKALIDQYFYKLSRTFLKNNQTKIREQAVFVYSPEIHEAALDFSPNANPRSSMTPISGWTNTPIREASSTPSVQTTTRSVLRNEPLLTASRKDYLAALGGRNDGRGLNVPDVERLDQELAAQNSMLREHSSRLSSQAAQCADHEGRLRDHHARIEDQERCVRAQASRILEQDDTIKSQKRHIEQQDAQIRLITHQLTNFQKTLDDMQNTIKAVRSDRAVEQFSTTGQASFVDNFELMVRVMRDAQSSAQEIQTLRAQNQDLQSRFTKVHSAMGIMEADSADLTSSAEQTASGTQILGKRKRNLSAGRVTPSRLGDSPQVKDRRVVRFEDHESNQSAVVIQSHSSQITPSQDDTMARHDVYNPVDQPSHDLARSSQTPTYAFVTGKALQAMGDTEQTMHANSGPARGQRQSDQDSARLRSIGDLKGAKLVPAEAEEDSVDQVMEDDSMDELVADQSPYEANTPQKLNPNALRNTSVNSLSKERHVSSEAREDAQTMPDQRVLEAVSVPDESDNDDFYIPNAEEDSPQSDSVRSGRGASTEDTVPVNDNVDFSSEDEYVEPKRTRAQPRKISHRRVTDLWNSREARSMAPEPGKRRRTMPANTGPKLLTLDRVRLATPQMFSEAISKGEEPKAARPPRINTRQENLHKELRELGLEEWIPKDKKSKEYRAIVAKARADYREAKKARFLRENGINYVSGSRTALSALQNARASSGSQVDATVEDENPLPDKPANLDEASQSSPESSRITRSRARHSGDSLQGGLGESELDHDQDHGGVNEARREADAGTEHELEGETLTEIEPPVKQAGKRGRPPNKTHRERKASSRVEKSGPGGDKPEVGNGFEEQAVPTDTVEVHAKSQGVGRPPTEGKVDGAGSARPAASSMSANESGHDRVTQKGPDGAIGDQTIDHLMAQFTSDHRALSSSKQDGRLISLQGRTSSSQMSTEDMVASRDRMAMEAMERDD